MRQPVERFAAGAAVFWEGEPAKHTFEVIEGTLRALRILGDGRRVIMGFLRPGDLLGVPLKDDYLYTVQAVTPAELRRVPRRRLENESARAPYLREQLFSRLCDEMAAAQDQMVFLSRRSADEKVAGFLLMMARG
ncbi:Crp/Fnr family transcriptional regulator [Sinorhizobium sp. 7-81]|nr:Crp/Fnr family transcriptional regulator [Sinorhizobium sp. 8-89]MDK1491213.1 Crp/Fnr family transcriptional regulator [Sinorhizobium sp. 8-89]